MKRSSKLLLAIFGLLMVPSLAVAGLKDVGAVDPGTGFPLWYRDTAGTALALCTEQRPSPNASAGGAPMCFPIVPNPAGYTGNIGDENFYFNASSSIAGANGFSMLWEGALEATYATGTPVRGEEIVFARIRIVMDTNTAGTYTVTHPYGIEVFPDVKGGKRAVFHTVDIGVAPGIFSGALAGNVGPFLEWDRNVADPNAPFGIDPASGTAYQVAITNVDGTQVQFLGDPNFFHSVTGSPFGTNFVRVDGPPGSNLDGAGNDFIVTNLFAIVGQRHTLPIAQPLEVYRANLSVDPRGYAQVDVFTESIPGAKLIATANNVPTQEVLVDAVSGEGYGHVEFFALDAAGNPLPLDSQVTVTNIADNPHSKAAAALTDFVSTSLAVMFPDTRALSIVAETSIQMNPPDITIVELPGAVKSLPDATRPWIQRFDATIAPDATPPWQLTALSTRGGSHAQPVTLGSTNVPVQPGPTALPIPVATNENAAVTFPVLDASGQPANVLVLNPPASGVAVAGVNEITYTPRNLFFGTDSFTYLLSVPDPVNVGKWLYSNVGTVAVAVAAVNNPPTAVADSASTTSGVAVVVDVAANDTDIETAVVPSSVVITSQPLGGTLVNNGDGTVTYAPAAGYVGTDTFTYTIADDGSPPSVSAPGTVSVMVTGVPETVRVSRAEWIVSKNRYRIVGTSDVFGVGITNTVTVRSGTLANPGPVIGTAPIDQFGDWVVDVITTTPIFDVATMCNASTRRCQANAVSTGRGSTDFFVDQK